MRLKLFHQGGEFFSLPRKMPERPAKIRYMLSANVVFQLQDGDTALHKVRTVKKLPILGERLIYNR